MSFLTDEFALFCHRRRNGDAEFARFRSIAMGSANELEYHLMLARDLKLIQPKKPRNWPRAPLELKRMLTAECRKLDPQDFKYSWIGLDRPKRPLERP